MEPNDNGAADLKLDGVYSYSQINNFLACERKYAYAYRDKWRMPRASRPMTLGTTVHLLLDEWWLGKGIDAFDVEEIFHQVADLGETATVEEGISIAEHALWLMRRYNKMYEKEREFVTVLEIETSKTFELPQLGERRFGLVAKLDMIVDSKHHGGKVFIDFKTVGKKAQEDWVDISPQFSIYHLALRETGTEVICSLLDSIYTYRNKREGEYLAWDDKSIPVEESFSRILVDRDDGMLDVIAEEAYRACDRMWNLRQSNFEPLRNISPACMWCEFRAPCYEALRGDYAGERAVLQEHFSSPSHKRPVVMVQSAPIEQEEMVQLD